MNETERSEFEFLLQLKPERSRMTRKVLELVGSRLETLEAGEDERWRNWILRMKVIKSENLCDDFLLHFLPII